MTITLGTLSLDRCEDVRVREQMEEVGGRDARCIELVGIIQRATISEVEAALDALCAVASDSDYRTPLMLRTGRRLWVRRLRFTREVNHRARTGTFVLGLEAQNPFEESIQEYWATWTLDAQELPCRLESAGNAPAPFALLVNPVRDLVEPVFSDGVRSLRFNGVAAAGKSLLIDGIAGQITLNGADVAAWTSGDFPLASPGVTLLNCVASQPEAFATVSWRDRWW